MTTDPRVLSAQERADLQRIAKAATPGVWTVRGGNHHEGDPFVAFGDGSSDSSLPSFADATHIAAFNPETALRLLARLTAVEASRDAALLRERQEQAWRRQADVGNRERDEEIEQLEAKVTVVEAERDAAAAQQRIETPCPSCGHRTLFIATGGHLTCSWLKCQEPGLERQQRNYERNLERVEAERDALRDMVFSCPACGDPGARPVERDVDIHSGAIYTCDHCQARVTFTVEPLSPPEPTAGETT